MNSAHAVLIRKAQPEDAESLSDMNLEFNGVIRRSGDIQAALVNKQEQVWLAINEQGEALGFICAQILHSFCYEYPYAEITELYVRETAREQGIAVQLIKQVEWELRGDHQVTMITVRTSPYNEAAVRTYTAAGYKQKDEALFQRKLIPME